MSWAAELKDVKFSWSKGRLILDIPELQISENRFTFLRGPSGSGKTTLLNLLGGVTVPDSGAIHVLGHPFHNMRSSKRDEIRSADIGFIFQMFNLIPYLSAIENVLLSTFFSRKRRLRLEGKEQSEATRLLDRLAIPKNHYHSPVNELSVGQQQRVAAARAFLGRPKMLIADEPTSSLDATRKDDFINLLKEECESSKMTLVFVSHDPSLEKHFDEVIDLTKVNRVSGEGMR